MNQVAPRDKVQRTIYSRPWYNPNNYTEARTHSDRSQFVIRIFMNFDSEQCADNPFTSQTWKLRDLDIETATSSIYRLYQELDGWEGISGWCGPIFSFSGGYEKYYELTGIGPTSTFIRNGALVMTLFAAWCRIEECYVLSNEVALDLACRLDAISSVDQQHDRLLHITKKAIEMVNNPNDDTAWSVRRLSTESSWVQKEIVRPALADLREPG